MKVSKSLSLVLWLSALALNGCATGDETNPDGTPVAKAPSSTTPRLFDCMGENQTKDSKSRKDCLPNDADAAARDTEAGAGVGGIRP